jgi:uncharacterized Tic20 family protein
MPSEYPFHRGEHEETDITASSRFLIPFVHLSMFSAALVPYGWVLGPLCVLYTIGNRHPLVHREATRAFNFALTVTLIALGVHVYGIVEHRTPDMETMWIGDIYVTVVACMFPLWSTISAYHQGQSLYPAIPFIRPPKPEPAKRPSRKTV